MPVAHHTHRDASGNPLKCPDLPKGFPVQGPATPFARVGDASGRDGASAGEAEGAGPVRVVRIGRTWFATRPTCAPCGFLVAFSRHIDPDLPFFYDPGCMNRHRRLWIRYFGRLDIPRGTPRRTRIWLLIQGVPLDFLSESNRRVRDHTYMLIARSQLVRKAVRALARAAHRSVPREILAHTHNYIKQEVPSERHRLVLALVAS
ncbi:uncharacterized protein C8Q71DRAFT_78015 [Rhodofomes roseus]|uniref:Uncharacterized protein n=1 Tax=Rhodofomes roseus TaxID=34475 RepID=A0ABQ8KF20_9APHY|nr:uncharacterized protein C8Q71DRAFT_78015 [Rhodofomes roseus]KAH9836339.1 hypothetical protein C8Q71DRAFT_78015 [Rhodofomes roseus]